MDTPSRSSDSPWQGDLFEFNHGERSMTRFPPNVESISVNPESSRVWLIVRRNDTELRFPLKFEDAEHLAKMLTGAA